MPQINLYHTNWIIQSNDALQHTCFYTTIDLRKMFYCMSELPSKFNVSNDDHLPKFTFAQLSKQNITSQQLYFWSAPIDLIENYQFYLNQLLITNDLLSLETQVFYNCTMPRFGPMCQYQFDYYQPQHSSLNEIIQNFYYNHEYNSSDLTCYTHLKCNRGSLPACLDWKEICNGEINCFNDGIDEEHCWQLEINECQEDEYRCRNGQCISLSFYNDESHAADCFDTSDEPAHNIYFDTLCKPNDVPSFSCEDLSYTFKVNYHMKRAELLMGTMYLNKYSLASDNCWSAFKCFLSSIDSQFSSCNNFCKHDTCRQIIQNDCPEILYFPNVPVLFGNLYFAYKNYDLQLNRSIFSDVPFYICYAMSEYDDFFINSNKTFHNNMTCISYKLYGCEWSPWLKSVKGINECRITKLHSLLKIYHLSFRYTSEICNRSNMYRCVRSSKCVSIYRLIDHIYDCPYHDDEDIHLINSSNVIKQLNRTHFKCPTSNEYIHPSRTNDGKCDCEHIGGMLCEDEDGYINYVQTNILFQHICDGFIDLLSKIVLEQNETDETECEQWQCNNIYTRCNGVWNCLNGADESGCNSHSILNCSSKHHPCVLPNTNQLICLPIEKIYDGNVDCLGATDEPTLCGEWVQEIPNVFLVFAHFYCINQSPESCMDNRYSCCLDSTQLCNGHKNCEHGDDEQFCTNQTIKKYPNQHSRDNQNFTNVEKFLFDYRLPKRKLSIIYFTLDGLVELGKNHVKNIENPMFSSSSIIQMSDKYLSRCHRGLDLRVWLNHEKNLSKNTCFCPPSYYGDQCQYQNQRISLAIKFRALSGSWQTLFAIVISLIDDSDQRIIHSYEQISFLSQRDCQHKFNFYLLYSTRSKDATKNYAIHIDFYEKNPLSYRGSILLPVIFPFLPVHRLAFLIDIPRSDNDNVRSCLNDECIYGKCIKYVDNPQNLTFCQCEKGWSGKYCTIQHRCKCSNDSLCIGISPNNRSICVCPLHRFGSRCFLNDTTCETNTNDTCQHGSQCISNGDSLTSDRNFVCICRKGYTGNRCEIVDNQLIISFGKGVILSQSIFIHFIELSFDRTKFNRIVRATTMRVILLRQDSMTIHWARPFHLVFTEFKDTHTYYLTVLQKIYNQSTTINRTINLSDRCPNISELFNKTFLQWNLIRRIKYYHLPCQNRSLNLSCFHDEVHFCLCYDFEQERLANCFNFDHNMSLDCFGQNECENGGECLQDNQDCPTRSICICRPCFYGRRCQFTTSGFGLSLDGILGYHIIPNLSLNQQSFIIKMSVALIVIFLLVGFINGVLSLITFKNKVVREVGCGVYLLGSSITTLLIMIMFGLKFFILLFGQMSMISNRTFLLIQCHSFDFLLRVCLCMDQWLNACVSIERAITVIKATGFDKNKSKRTAKFVIIILLIVIVGTSIHDPIYRQLIDEENDVDNVKRTWCIVKYPPSLEIYNYIIHIFHFFGPFLINIFSAIILITKKSRQQLSINIHQSYRTILREQFQQHKHLLTAPIVLVILALPRLIITFISKCMKSTDNVWLYLIGYFISFIPPMLTFIVFIVPSKFYKKEFRKTVAQYRGNIQRRLRIMSQR